jgi:Uma2 family endonuclease
MIQRSTQTRQFGPADHGRRMSYDEFLAGDYQEGYRYEIIDGELYVSPAPNMPHMVVVSWLWKTLDTYSQKQPHIINFVTSPARVFLPDRPEITAPEPDLAAFRNVPLDVPDEELDWRAFSPILVAEVISPDDPKKDEVRNRELYLEVPSIKEYWLFDPRQSSMRPRLRVHRRQARKWKIIEVAPGGTYTTRLLPGFELVVHRSK